MPITFMALLTINPVGAFRETPLQEGYYRRSLRGILTRRPCQNASTEMPPVWGSLTPKIPLTSAPQKNLSRKSGEV